MLQQLAGFFMKQTDRAMSAAGPSTPTPQQGDATTAASTSTWTLPQAKNLLSPTVAAVLVSQCTGLIYGYSTTIISGLSSTLVLHTFGNYLNVARAADDTVAALTGTLTACIFVGGCIGSFLGPICADRYGRREALFLCGAMAIVAQVLLASINQFVAVVILRAATGVAVGFSCTVGPLYLSEIAPPSLRGRLGVLFEIGITVGALIAYMMNYLLSTDLNGSIDAPVADWRWQLQLGVGSVFGLLLCLLPYKLPETNISALAEASTVLMTVDDTAKQYLQDTPTSALQYDDRTLDNHLAAKHSTGYLPERATNEDVAQSSGPDALAVAMHSATHSSHLTAANESLSITTVDVQPGTITTLDCTTVRSDSSTGKALHQHAVNPMQHGPWQHLFTTRDGSKYVFYAVLLCFIDMFTGINAVFFYSPVIFTNAGLNNVLLYTFVAVGIWEVVSTLAPYLLVDRVGRRPLMLWSLAMMTVSQLLLALTFLVFPSSVAPALSIVFLLLFLGAWQLGTGALFFLLATELFPDYCREEACALTNIVSWSLNITISYLFPVLTAAIGQSGMFFIQFGVCAACLGLSILYLPETQTQSFAATKYVHS